MPEVSLLHPNLVAGRFIKARLIAVPALMAATLPGVNGRIFDGHTSSFPAVLYDVNSNPPSTPDIGLSDQTYYARFLIKVVGKDLTKGDLEDTYALVKGALHRTSGPVAGGGYIVKCYEDAPHTLNFRDPRTAVRYPEVGGFYSFQIELITAPVP
jgi:hypothetical protein